MIVDEFTNLLRYSPLLPQLNAISAYISDKNYCLSNCMLEDGKTKVFIVEDEKNENELFECHREYIDLVYIVSGCETMGITPNQYTKVMKPLNEDKEISRCEEKYTILNLKKGMFVILFPGEAHCPSLERNTIGDNVVKLVFKIKTTAPNI